MSEVQENKFKAKLVHFRDRSQVFIINNSPSISESRTVNYDEIRPIHMPGSIMAYVTTPSRTFGVSDVKLISQTSQQATRNMIDLQMLRSWMLPRFGQGVVFKSTAPISAGEGPSAMAPKAEVAARNRKLKEIDDKNLKMLKSNEEYNSKINNNELLGMPPPILHFSAYSDSSQSKNRVNTLLQNIQKIPVVMTNLSIAYPNDLDYIPTTTGVPFPTIMTISFDLTETHSPKSFDEFNLDNFRAGILGGF